MKKPSAPGDTRTPRRTKRAGKRAVSIEPTSPISDSKSAATLTLLSPELHGWKLDGDWPGLFKLYIRGSESMAELAPELQRTVNMRESGHSLTDVSAEHGSRALYILAIGAMTANEEGSLKWMAETVFRDLVDSVGPLVLKILTSEREEQCSNAATDVAALFKRIADGLVRTKFPRAARGSGDAVDKATLAIFEARLLCEYHRRLPTKREVRTRLEMIGVGFGKTKDLDGKWSDVFSRAQLSGLPD
jgi:hypothetical protein